VHPTDPATRPPAGVLNAPRDRKRGRHSNRRLHFGRFALLVAIALITSAGVALVLPSVFPPEPVSMMADPAFDVDQFYRTHPGAADGREIAYAFAPGLPSQPKPVAGLNQAQTNNAYIIVEVGRQMKLPKRAHMIAIATALQETRLRNMANDSVPASLKLKHEGVGSNFDSVGLFQQRPSQGWGTVAQLMDPAQASARFYARLLKVSNWQDLSITAAAQAVQRSGFPGAYAQHAESAEKIVAALPSYS
jgi:hypothetical protein